MSTIITGNAANVTTPLHATILSAVAGSGITTCTTTAPHLFGGNDIILVTGATGMTGLNAQWTITVTGSTTFTVPSALSGTYGASSATAVDYSMTPQIQVPSDGDPTNVQLSGLLSGLQALADRTQFLAEIVSRTPLGWAWTYFGDLTFSGARCTVEWANLSNLTSDASANGDWFGAWTWDTTSTVTAFAGSVTTYASGAALNVAAPNAVGLSSAFTRELVTPLIPVSINANCTMVGLTTGVYYHSVGNTGGAGYISCFALDELVDGAQIFVDGLSIRYNNTAATHSPANPAVVTLISVGASGITTTIGSLTLPASSVNGVQVATINNTATTVNMTNTSYYLIIQGEGGSSANDQYWYAPTILFGNITYVGQR